MLVSYSGTIRGLSFLLDGPDMRPHSEKSKLRAPLKSICRRIALKYDAMRYMRKMRRR